MIKALNRLNDQLRVPVTHKLFGEFLCFRASQWAACADDERLLRVPFRIGADLLQCRFDLFDCMSNV